MSLLISPLTRCAYLLFHITALEYPFHYFNRNTVFVVLIFFKFSQECGKQSFYRLDTRSIEKHKPTVSIAIISTLFENLFSHTFYENDQI